MFSLSTQKIENIKNTCMEILAKFVVKISYQLSNIIDYDHIVLEIDDMFLMQNHNKSWTMGVCNSYISFMQVENIRNDFFHQFELM